jgi:Vault protein inter-alpha-trypsin domain
MITRVIDPQVKEERQVLVPLKHVNLQGRIEAGHTTLDAQLSFVNLSETDQPIECTFEMPIDQQTVITKVLVQIDDRIVEAKIKAKEEAKEQYDDAMAAGNTAVYAERSGKHQEKITLKLGNLLPN